MRTRIERQTAGFTLIEMLMVVAIIGIMAAIAIPNYLSMRARAKEAGVIANAHTLQLACEDFAAQNNATYATDFATTLANGQVLLDLLPTALHNPFDTAASAATDAGPDEAGEVGYDTAGIVGIGYRITGLGHHAQPVIELQNGG
jgi:prepilin-type N-terminal cleavage/methylation domain-containing protein